MSTFLKKIMKFKISLLFICFILLSYLLLKYALPLIASDKITQILQEQTSQEVIIENIDFEPIGLVLVFQGVSLNKKKIIDEIFLKLSLNEVLSKKILITEIKIDQIQVNLVKEKNGYVISGLNKHIEKIEKKVNKQPEKSRVWEIKIKETNLINSKVIFKDGPTLKIKKLSISDISSIDSIKKTTIEAQMSINDSTLTLTGFATNVIASAKGEISVMTDQFDLEDLAYFQQEKSRKIIGSITTKTSLAFQKNQYKVKTNLQLENFKVFSSNLKTIDYFIPKLDLKKGIFNIYNNDLSVSVSEAIFTNLILSIEKGQIKKRYSKSAKINLRNLIFKNSSKDTFLSTQYNDSGYVELQEITTQQDEKMTVKLKNFDLLPLSTTFESVLGYQIETGKVNLDIDILSSDNKRKGKAKVELNQFQVDDQDQSGQKLKRKTKLPLKTAISLIRNDNGNINLDLDIKGDEKNVQFGFLPLLKAGIGSLLLSKLNSIIATRAATQFLPLLVSSIPFSPANALVLINGGYKFLTKPRFQNIEFTYGSNDIKKESNQVTQKLRDFLIEKSNFNFTICPIANSFEIESLDKEKNQEQTLELAYKRIENIKAKLAQEPSVLSQVVFCRPKVINNKTNKGILEISF